jgi:hypothetical protein
VELLVIVACCWMGSVMFCICPILGYRKTGWNSVLCEFEVSTLP